MKVGTYEYKGFYYDMMLASEGDWMEQKNHFYANGGSFNSDYHKTFEAADADIKGKIDEFLTDVPKDVDGLVEALGDLLVWHGYEECELDEAAAKILITKFLEANRG